jgi:hypothetical protein
MQLEYAKNPKWANAEQTLIDLTIKWDGIDEELPFTASPDDSEAHGRALFAAAQAGEFGPVAAYVASPPNPPFVPQQVTNAQGTVALIQAGLWPQVVAYVDAIEDPIQKAIAEVALYKTTHWQRNSPFLNQAATALNISQEQMDQLFIQASQVLL